MHYMIADFKERLEILAVVTVKVRCPLGCDPLQFGGTYQRFVRICTLLILP